MLPGYPAGVAATSPPYPTPGWATTQVYPAHTPAYPPRIPPVVSQELRERLDTPERDLLE